MVVSLSCLFFSRTDTRHNSQTRKTGLSGNGVARHASRIAFFFFRTSRHITLYKLTIHAVFQRGKGGRAEREPKNVNETHLTFGAVPRRLRSIYSYECVCVSAGVGCVPVLVSDTCCAKPSVWFGESRALADRLQLPGSVRKLKKKRWRETNSRIPRQSQMLQCHVEVTTLPLRCSADFA